MKKDTFNTLFKNPSSNKIKSMMLSNDDFDESKNCVGFGMIHHKFRVSAYTDV